MTSEPDVLVSWGDSIAWITINRPERLNAFTADTLQALAAAVTDCGAAESIRAIVLTGAGRAFSAGADATGEATDSGNPDTSTIEAANRLVQAIREVPKPVVAAVNGPAVGVGCSIAIAADLTIARESAYFLLAFANIGLMPDGGATALLPALIGLSRANRMAMLAERIPAATAADWGLIAQVVPDLEFDTAVADLASRLATGPTLAYASTKRAFNTTALAALDTALRIETTGQTALFASNDFKEGVAAFQQKRPASFTGS